MLPPEPRDPTLTTLLPGLATRRSAIATRCTTAHRQGTAPAEAQDEGSLQARKARPQPAAEAGLRERSRTAPPRGAQGTGREALPRGERQPRRRQRSASRRAGLARSAGGKGPRCRAAGQADASRAACAPQPRPFGDAGARGLKPGSEGFDAEVYADGGGFTALAGSHPYQVDMTSPSTRAGEAPTCATCASTCPQVCSSTPPTEPASSARVGLHDAAHATLPGRQRIRRELPRALPGRHGRSDQRDRRRQDAHLRPLQPAARSRHRGAVRCLAVRHPLVFDARINADVPGAYVEPRGERDPAEPAAARLKVSLWGVPWDASHNAERATA